MKKYEHNMPPRVDTIEDNNVDYDNNSIPVMRQRIAELEAKIKQVAEEFNKQHELLDQYELECTDEIVRLKNQKISELEAKLEEVEGQYAYECECNKQLVELQEENAKLQEQLKNAYCPKYKTGQEVWFIDPEKDMAKGIILITEFDNGNIFYTILDVHDTDYTEYRREEEVFATEDDAQKYLEERK